VGACSRVGGIVACMCVCLRACVPDAACVRVCCALAGPGAGAGVCCHGVVHTLTLADWNQIVRTEGGGGFAPGYLAVEVNVTTYSGKTLRAWTLKTHPLSKTVTRFFPSQRYKTLCVKGAEDCGVAAEYLDFLRAQVPNAPRLRCPLPLVACTRKCLLHAAPGLLRVSLTIPLPPPASPPTKPASSCGRWA
jgi:hypothetical protein